MKNPKSDSGKIILVTKASGEKEAFATAKLERSLINSGASHDLVKEILADIMVWIYDGVTTRKIYSRAFALLHRSQALAALRYKLKQAIMELGPTGYPFEKLVGRIFEKQGYAVSVGQILEGHCITHEVDVIATGKDTQCLVECKYSQDQGKQVSIQVPLYVRSRMDDIIRKRQEMPEYHGYKFIGWVATNTRFTMDSIQYGKCSGLQLLGWDYPAGNGLKELIEREKIYPVTVLHQLTRKEKLDLLNLGIVTCSQLNLDRKVIDDFALSNKKLRALLQELDDICG
jgi:hypothetical protein